MPRTHSPLPVRSRRHQAAVGALVLGLLTACGSTVQTDGQLAVVNGQGGLGSVDGSGTPLSAAGSLDGGSLDAPGGSGSLPGGTGGIAGAGTGGSDGTSSNPGTTGTPGVPGSPDTSGGDPSQTPGSGQPPVGGDGEPVSIGYVVAKDVGAATAALGYGELTTGDGATQARAAVDLVNKQGGLGGHPIEPVIVELDATGDLKAQFVAACSTFFEDNDVSAVITVYGDDQVRSCTSNAGVPYVDANISIPATSLARFPNLIQPSMPTTETGATALVDGLARSGWFEPTSPTEIIKVGLLTHDTAAYDEIPGLVAARLKAAGLSLTSTYRMPIDDIGRASAAGRSATLRFASEGVNRVLAVDKGGFALSWFAVSASLQGYYPALGISTLSNPSAIPIVLSPEALDGSAGIGWSPVFDTAPTLQPATSARTGACLQAMSNAGEKMANPGARQGGVLACEATYFLGDAWRSGTTTLAAFLQGAKALSTKYQAVSAFGTDFSASRAGATSFRPVGYEAGCDCFRYTGSTAKF